MTLPILTYHAVEMTSNERDGMPANKLLYLLKRNIFEEQMRYLAEQKFKTILIEHLIRVVSGETSLPERVVCLTFDDGNASDYWLTYPVLRQYGLKATFFVVTDRVGTPGHVTWDELREMSANGMSVESHSHTHPFFSQCLASEVREEFIRSKTIIEKYIGKSVEVFSVPGGDWNERYRQLVKECGYQAVCTSKAGINHEPLDLLALRRLSIRRSDSLDKFVSLVTLDLRTLFMNGVKTGLLSLLRRSIGLDQYNFLRARLLRSRRH